MRRTVRVLLGAGLLATLAGCGAGHTTTSAAGNSTAAAATLTAADLQNLAAAFDSYSQTPLSCPAQVVPGTRRQRP